VSEFSGFSPESLEFLQNVKSHNSKAWFDQNRADYERLLLTPFRHLVSALAPAMLSADSDIQVRPAINKTISRIFRDTRFSADKSLFRDTMWLVFKRPGKDWAISIPGFYFEISPPMYRYGMGFYSAAPDIMAAFRQKIDAKPGAFAEAIAFMESDGRYNLEGEKYKRPIPCNHPENIQAWYQMKTFYLAHNRQPDELLFSKALFDELLDGFLLIAPLYKFLTQLKPS